MASVGVEVSENGLCICVLSGTARDFRVESVTVRDFDEPLDFARALETTRDIMRQLDLPADSLALSLPLSKCLTRLVELPFVDEQQARSVLPFESESYLGKSADQFVLSYFPAGDDGKSSRYLVVALPVDEIDRCLKACAGAALEPDVIEADGLAYYYLARELAPALDGDEFLVLAADSDRVFLLAVRPGGLAAVRNITTGLSSGKPDVDAVLMDLEGAQVEPRAGATDPGLSAEEQTLIVELKKSLLALPFEDWDGTTLLVERDTLSERLKAALSSELRLKLVPVKDVLSQKSWAPASEEPTPVERYCCALGLAIEGLTDQPGAVGFRKGRFALRDKYDVLRIPAVFVSLAALLLALAVAGVTWYRAHDFARRARKATAKIHQVWERAYPGENPPPDIALELAKRYKTAVAAMGIGGSRPSLRPVLEDWVEIESALRTAGIGFEWQQIDAGQKAIIFREFRSRSSELVIKTLNAIGPYTADAPKTEYEGGREVFDLRVAFKEE